VRNGLGALTPPVILAAEPTVRLGLAPHEVEAIADLDIATRFPASIKGGD
jgi:hypothetical protein